MSGIVVVFLRPDGGNGFGHVGWGFMDPSDKSWFLGSMENPSGWPVNLPGWTGFWYVRAPNGDAAAKAMLNPTSAGAPNGSPPYKTAKKVDVVVPNLSAAQEKIREWAHRPFVAVGGNCLNCTYDILTAYGAALPDPTPNPVDWVPNNWFNDIAGQIVPA